MFIILNWKSITLEATISGLVLIKYVLALGLTTLAEFSDQSKQ